MDRSYTVSIYYSKENLLAHTSFNAFSEAEEFFLQLQQFSQEAVEIWLKWKQSLFEEHLLDHYKMPELSHVIKANF